MFCLIKNIFNFLSNISTLFVWNDIQILKNSFINLSFIYSQQNVESSVTMEAAVSGRTSADVNAGTVERTVLSVSIMYTVNYTMEVAVPGRTSAYVNAGIPERTALSVSTVYRNTVNYTTEVAVSGRTSADVNVGILERTALSVSIP